jgi:hypothetical protein
MPDNLGLIFAAFFRKNLKLLSNIRAGPAPKVSHPFEDVI